MNTVTESKFCSIQIKLEHEKRRLEVTFSNSNNKGFNEETVYTMFQLVSNISIETVFQGTYSTDMYN
jgi:hypothetical protein